MTTIVRDLAHSTRARLQTCSIARRHEDYRDVSEKAASHSCFRLPPMSELRRPQSEAMRIAAESRCAVRPAQQADQTLPAEAPDRREEQREAASPASIRSACGSQMHFAGWRRLVGLQARHRGEALLLARQGLLSARANRQGYKPDVAPFVVSSSIGHVRLAVLSRRVRYALFWFADFWWFLLCALPCRKR